MLLLIVVNRSSRLGAMADDWRKIVGCKLEDHGLFCCLLSLGFLFLESLVYWSTRYCDAGNTHIWSMTVLDDNCVLQVLVSIKWWAVLMGGATNRSRISTHFSIITNFLTVQT